MTGNPNVTALTIMFLLALVISGAMIFFKSILGPRSTNPEKEIPFECGVHPQGSPRTGVNIRYYLVAILFVIFDIAFIFLYPWAVQFRKLGTPGFLQMLVFLVVLMLGLYYIIRKGVLQWK